MDELRLYFMHLAQVGDIEVLENTLSISVELTDGYEAFVKKTKENEQLELC